MEEFITGADVSTLQQIEDFGGCFYEGDQKRDLLDILKENGFTHIRLKVWNNPGLPDSDPAGYNNKEHVLAMAKRIAQKGFKLLIDFHYSDFWTDPQKQAKPREWSGLSFDALKEAVRAYTADVLGALAAQGTTPDMVQVGNEVTNGFLWDDGYLAGSEATPEQWDRFSALLTSGLQGVADVDKGIKTMIHIDRGGDYKASKIFFDNILTRGMSFDIIGQSFYCQWQGTLPELAYNLNRLALDYHKDIIVVEMAHPWTHKTDSSMPNKVTTAYEEYPASVEGQAGFIQALKTIIREVPNNRGRGFFYWEPGFITVEGAGWRYGEGNEWGNMTLFDFNGRLLESIKAFR